MKKLRITHHSPAYWRAIFDNPSEEAVFLPNLLFATMSMNANELTFPQDLKMKVAKAITHDDEDVTRAILCLKKRQSTYLKSWAATEAFQDLVNEGLLLNISGKKNTKQSAGS